MCKEEKPIEMKPRGSCPCVRSDEITSCDAETDSASECEIISENKISLNQVVEVSSENEPPRKKKKTEEAQSEVMVLHVDDAPVQRDVQIIQVQSAPRRKPDLELVKFVPPPPLNRSQRKEGAFAGPFESEIQIVNVIPPLHQRQKPKGK